MKTQTQRIGDMLLALNRAVPQDSTFGVNVRTYRFGNLERTNINPQNRQQIRRNLRHTVPVERDYREEITYRFYKSL